MIQISAPVQLGNSGGPVIDRYGNILGIVTKKLDALFVASKTKDIPQNVNFAIKSSLIANFLTSNGVTPGDDIKSREMPSEATAEPAKMFTVQVLCK